MAGEQALGVLGFEFFFWSSADGDYGYLTREESLRVN